MIIFKITFFKLKKNIKKNLHVQVSLNVITSDN